MVDRTLYFPTPFGRVVALDAETGAERWTFDPGIDRSINAQRFMTSRGVATWVDPSAPIESWCARRILVATLDARLIALDARTGRRCQGFGTRGEVNLRHGVRNIRPDRNDYRQTSPPTVVRDLVIVGSSITDNSRVESPSGVVRAFDARNGRLRWSWEPLVDLVNDTSGSGHAVRSGAANAWSSFSVDTARNLVIIPTGSPSPDHSGALRPGPNRHANSVVALEATTGVLVWAYQLVHHDLWDYDLAAQPALADVRRDGQVTPVVIAAAKTGSLFFLDRNTGRPLFPVEEVRVPASDVPGERASATQPVPVLPLPLVPTSLTPDDAWGITALDRLWCRDRIAGLRSEGIFTPPSLRGTVAFPGFIGGMAWGGLAVDSRRGLLVTNTNRVAGIITLVPNAGRGQGSGSTIQLRTDSPQEGAPYGVRRELLLSPLGLPCNAPPWGTLVAVDMATGTVRWEVPLGSMRDLTTLADATEWGSVSLGGPLVTSAGLVFIGASMDRRLRAFDVLTGEQLWSAALPASAQATPMTYRATPGGRQYIVVAAGGHAMMGSALGDHLVAFALP
jgi:quinoprotein glucose dehydrogenase